MRIALIVDNPYRDLPGLVLLAAHLSQQGATCFLVPMHFSDQLCMLVPDLVLFNYLRVNNQKQARQMQEADVNVCVLDTEGGVLAHMDHYTKTLARDASLYRNVACFFSWGPKLAEHLKREGWYTENQIMITGAPRFDFYVPPLRCAALRSSPYVASYPPPLVLINGNFPVANPRFQTPEEEVRMMVERFGYDPARALEWQRASRQAMHELAALSNRLARKFPQATFVYRPHPFENTETYETLLERHENLQLSKVGTVDGWILRAKAVIHRSCSTAIEAGMAGVPALMPSWIPTAVSMPTAEDVSIHCDTEEYLADVLGDILKGDFMPPRALHHQLNTVISDWFYRIDGQAHERVAARILEFSPVGDGEQLARWKKCRNLAYGGEAGNSLRFKARAELLKGLQLPVHWSVKRWRSLNTERDWAWWTGSEKHFDAPVVSHLLDSIRACEPYSSSGPWQRVRVQSSQDRGDYHFGFLHGQAVTVFSE